MNCDVFISYSRKDMAVADRICAAFDKAGISYFIDRQGIGGGMEFPRVLAEAIVGCRKFLFLASANSYVSKFTNSEITFAFNKKDKNCILPYRIDTEAMPLELEFVFCNINWRNIEDHPIETVLVNDMLEMLGRAETASPASFGPPAGAGYAPASSAMYKVGDYYRENGRQGIVFEVDASGRHGKIMGLHRSPRQLQWGPRLWDTYGADDRGFGMRNQLVIERLRDWKEDFPAFAWCAAQGEGWYLPAIGELEAIFKNKDLLQAACAKYGGDSDIDWCYWSSTEGSELHAWYVVMSRGRVGSNCRDCFNHVLPVAAF